MFNEDTKKYNNEQLKKRYLYIYAKYPDSDFAKASAIKAAFLEKNDPLSAKKHFISYLAYAPCGKYSLLAIEELKKYKQYLTSEDNEILAKAYMSNNLYKEAHEILKADNFAANWYNLSVCEHNLKEFSLEKDTILKGLALHYSPVQEKDISNAIDRLIKITNSNRIQTLQDMSTQFKSSSAYPTIIYKLAESLTSIRSIKMYEYIVDTYPDSIWASNSLWEVFRYNYNQKRFKTCKSLAFEYQKIYPKEADAARISYWLGKVFLKEKKYKLAKEQFNKTIENYPLSYYAFMSQRQLKIAQENRIFNKKKITSYNIDKLPKYIFKDDKTLLYLLQNCDWQTIDELKLNNQYIKSWILNKKGYRAESIKTAQDALIEDLSQVSDNKESAKLAYDDYRLKLIYPVFYSNEINDNSAKRDLSPYLFLSLVREESHFNPKAKSGVGAIGLSQIMPATASHIEKTTITQERLMDENENIRIGEEYFKFLIEKYSDNVYYAIISYNAGFGNLEKWLKDPEINTGDIDELIENIPFNETKTYIKKVLSSYWAYQNVYSLKNL